MKTRNPVVLGLLFGATFFASHATAVQINRPEGLVAVWGNYTISPARMTNITRIAAGDGWSLAIAPGGKVLFWGATDANGAQTGVLPGTVSSNIVDISAGIYGIALRDDTTPVMWGHNNYVPGGQLSADAGLTNLVKVISSRAQQFWGIKSDRSAVVLNSYLLPTCPLPNVTGVEDIAPMGGTCGGWSYGLILYTNGVVQDYGMRNGQPVILAPEAQGSKAIAASEYTGMVLKSNGTVVCWSIINGSTITDIYGSSLVPPESVTNVVAIAIGFRHYMALRADGTVVTWGALPEASLPQPPGLSNVMQISSGTSHCLALRSNGTVVAWGSQSAVGVMPGDRAVKVACSYQDIYCLRQDSTVAHMGSSTLPDGLTNIVDVDVDPQGPALALKADGTVVAWNNGVTTVPPEATNVAAIAAAGINFLGRTINVALRSNHTVFAWAQDAPVNIPPDGFPADHVLQDYPGISAIDAADVNIVALTTGGEVRTWTGNNLPAPAGLNNVVAVAIGQGHGLALINDGTVTGWGNWNPPPGPLVNIIKIAAKSVNCQGCIPVNGSVALRSDGTVISWGGTFPPPSDLAGVFDISTSGYNSAALFVPPDPPTVTRSCPPSGDVGTIVRIDGNSFLPVNGVKFNGTSASFSNDFNFILYATVPPGATTGSIEITSPYGTAIITNFVVPNGLTPIQTWRSINFVSPANTGIGADSADPDGDGMVNLIEYQMHTNPNLSDRTASLTARKLINSSGQRYLEFAVRHYSLATDVTLHYEYKTNLFQAWLPYTGPLIDVGVEPLAACQLENSIKQVLSPSGTNTFYLHYYVTRP